MNRTCASHSRLPAISTFLLVCGLCLIGEQSSESQTVPSAPTAPVAPVTVPLAAPVQGAQTVTAPRSSSNAESQTGTTQSASDAANSSRADKARSNETDRTVPTTPDATTEFQRLVLDSTGQALPIFGASLFNSVPSTFAPVDNIPVTADYTIGPGDELRIQLSGQQNQQGSFIVDRSGDISFPQVGTIHVAGIKYSQLQGFLKSQLSRDFRNFDLNVNLGQLRSIQVFVVGFARRPGSYTVSSLSTLLNALFASGGPTPQGSLRDIQVQRVTKTIAHFDLYDLLLRGDKSKDIVLEPGDVIFIPPVGAQAALSGSIDNAGIYEVLPGTKVSAAIKLAGGETAVALGTQVRIERIFEHSMRALTDVDLSRNDPDLQDGDIIEVGEILGRYRNAVTLRGNVAAPGRYVWREGMRITDLVSTKDALVTRDYYRRRNALGTVPLGFAPVGSQTLQVRGTESSSSSDAAVQSGSSSTSTTGGSSVGAALTNSNGLFPPTTDVVLSAPDIDWSYAVIERLDEQTLTTSLISFNPGKLFLEGDQTQNLILKPGDIVTFFSTADLKVPTSQQTRFVRLEGEFVAAGIYSVTPGETLRHLLQRAGGFTPDAYLYGSEFTRQSTKRVQQQRLNEFADSVEAQVAQLSANGQARALSSQDSAAIQASTQQVNAVVARLRRVQPIGRIVLELRPDSRGIEAVPDLPLEDGDRFVLPRVPSTVAVEGQVYSANAFVFVRNRRERDYLRQAGGPDRNADRRRAFILRADGSVFSRQYGDVEKATIFPGDTIVVPPQLDRRAVLRNLVDLSNVIGGFGLGAAAINILR